MGLLGYMSYELKIDTQFITMATWFAHLLTSLFYMRRLLSVVLESLTGSLTCIVI